MLIIGCDFHTRYQQIAIMDEATGELIERCLDRESGEAGAPLVAEQPVGILSLNALLDAFKNQGSAPGEIRTPSLLVRSYAC